MPFDSTQSNLVDLGRLLAEAPRNVVFVIGAGLSVPAGVPDWNHLYDDFLRPEFTEYVQDGFEGTSEESSKLASQEANLTDLWARGDFFSTRLPKQRYVDTVQRALKPSKVPETYEYLWALSPSGILDFNLDECTRTALGGMAHQATTAFDTGRYKGFLLQSKPFLLQPHGVRERPETWVLNSESRTRLLKDPDYRRFITSLLGSRRLVIIGFRPQDFAFQSLLLDDFRDSFSSLDHFWITQKLDDDGQAYAHAYHLKPIEYVASSTDHPEVLQILQELGRFRPHEPSAPFAYLGEAMDPAELPPENELRHEEMESIRDKLNAALRGAVQDLPDGEAGDAVQRLLGKYSASVRLAWTASAAPPYDRVCGYHLLHQLGEGAFSTVWEVTDPVDDSTYALKIMREDLATNRERFDAFRRGVRAIQILNEHRIPGMVRFRNSFEVPACVAMEFIDGATLDEELPHLTFLEALRAARQTAATVGAAHNLPLTVLHRDIKPQNVMLRRSSPEETIESRVVVLDFDLSWYEGAFGRSTLLGAHLNNYLAPEQITKDEKFSSHHTAVDVFGLGMLLYFVVSGREPSLNLQGVQTFEQDLAAAVEPRWHPAFEATPVYLAQLVKAATYTEQDRRIALPTLIAALDTVHAAERDQSVEPGSAFGTLEIARRIGGAWKFEVGELGQQEILLRYPGRSVTITISPAPGDSGSRSWQVVIDHVPEGNDPRGNLGKYLTDRASAASSILRRDQLFQATQEASPRSARITAIADDRRVSLADLKLLAQAIAEAASKLALQ